MRLILILCFITDICGLTNRSGFSHTPKPDPEPLKQKWGYVSVRTGAEMFFWMYLTKDYTHRPLILWLQGGPGSSSTGIGNFIEIGPLNLTQKKRDYAWTNNCSVVFVDSPVGTGYSYVWDKELIPKNDTQAATDLLTFLKIFYRRITDMVNLPLYIFGESYGGKIAVEFALQLSQAVKKKEISCHLAGVGLGGAWISPADYVENYAKFLYANSLIDTEGFSPIASVADKIYKEIKGGHFVNASDIYYDQMGPLVEKETNGVNFFNILAPSDQDFGAEHNHIHLTSLCHKLSRDCALRGSIPQSVARELSKLMNGPIKKYLKILKNVTWSGQSADIIKIMKTSFMRPAMKTVEKLLNTTSVEVMIYNGQHDLMVPTIGSETWVRKLKWAGSKKWMKAARKPFDSRNNVTLGFYKKYKNLSFYWILKTGHLVPKDAPFAAYRMLCHYLSIKC